MIKLFQPYISKEARDNVQRVLSGTQIAQGPEVDLFEKEFAAKFGFESWQIVTVNSGTAALELAYHMTFERGDHAIVPVLTCTATNVPLVRMGIDATFADIRGPRCLNLDPDDVSSKIQRNTRAVVFVHFGGNSSGLEDIEEVCSEHNLDLICDAAQALGSSLSRKARFSAISLQAIKSLTAGDGGILVCRDKEDAEMARKLRWFGYDREKKQKYGDCDLEIAGFKYHMNDIAAAIARGNLEHWDEIQQHREDINTVYQDAYGKAERSHNLIRGIWNPIVTMADYQAAKDMARRADPLSTWSGFEIGQHHYRNDKYSVFRAVSGYCPNMDDLGDKYFMLPCHMGMSLEDADKIASTLWGK